jgi:hypothetical protein
MRLHAAGRPGAAALLSSTVQSQENDMTELVMKTEAEVEDFTDELSDEALDRAEGAVCGVPGMTIHASAPSCLADR